MTTNDKAILTGIVDGVVNILFLAAGQLIAYAITLVPFLDTFQQGKYAWAKVPVGILLGVILKSVDRKKHEDPSPSKGLLPL